MKNPFNKEKPASITQSKSPGQGLDNVWAAIRRITAQLDAVNAKLHIVQTMAMRTEKKVYKEKETAPEDDHEREPVSSALFG